MTAPDESSNRRVIPRWRESGTSVETGEGRPLSSVSSTTEYAAVTSSLQRLQEEFTADANIGTAAELVSAARLFNTLDRAEDAAEFLLMHREDTTVSALQGAREVLGLTGLDDSVPPSDQKALSVTSLGVQVGELRARLRAFPINTLAHLDLARLFTALGKDDQAERHLRVAVGLSPHHRLTIRAVTRFYLHRQEPDRALRFLRNLPVVRQDPWLMATEIATATVAGRPQQLVRQARALLEAKNYPALHTSELAASIATLDVLDGANAKRIRQLMGRALEDPTENAVAQARWISKRVRLEARPPEELDVPRNFEARAWEAYQARQFETSRNLFTDWLRDEPFSSRPALMAGYLSDLLDASPRRAIELTRIGVRAEERNATLHNNLAFFLAESGELSQAEHSIASAQLYAQPAEEVAILATRGFIAFRRGDLELGERLYLEAIEQARTQHNEGVAVTAQLYFAREALLNDLPDASAILAEALNSVKLTPSADLTAVSIRIRRDLALNKNTPMPESESTGVFTG